MEIKIKHNEMKKSLDTLLGYKQRKRRRKKFNLKPFKEKFTDAAYCRSIEKRRGIEYGHLMMERIRADVQRMCREIRGEK